MNQAKPGTNRPVWDAESTHPDLTQLLRDVMQEVYDPELALNVNQLGLIRNVKFEDGQAILRVILTTPFCPYGPALLDVIKESAEEALGMPVVIDLDLGTWDFSMMDGEAADELGIF